MENFSSLTQHDADLLFQIEYGRRETIDLDIAGRFVLLGLLHPLQDVEATHALTSTGLDGHRIPLGLTQASRMFLAEIRDGLSSFSEWRPESRRGT